MKKIISVLSILVLVVIFGVFDLTKTANAQTNEEIQIKINQLLKKINELKLKLSQQQNNGQCLRFQRILSLGSSDVSTNNEVSALQYFLKKSGYYTDNITGKYDINTKNAVTTYQNANKINGLEKKYGIVGYQTRNVLNQNCLTTNYVTRTDDDTWVNFTSQKDGFKIKFPTDPKESELSFYKFSTELKSLSNPILYLSQKNDVSYAIALQKYGQDFYTKNNDAKITEDTLNNLLKNNNLILKRRIFTNPNRRNEIEFSAQHWNSDNYTKGKIIVTNSHRYVLAVTGSDIDEEKYNKFINSFTLIK